MDANQGMETEAVAHSIVVIPNIVNDLSFESNVSSTVPSSIVLELINEIGELEAVLNKINLGHLIPIFHGRS